MKDIGYGKDYAYDHDAEDGFSGADYWPDEMEPQTFYRPVERGFERQVIERLAYWDKLRARRSGPPRRAVRCCRPSTSSTRRPS
jgi:putative ATPase